MSTREAGSGEVGLVVAVALATMLAPLNSTMIAVALPPIAAQFHAGASATWLVTGYLLAMASLQPVAGKLGDRFGRRPLMLGGLAYFALASLGAALAPGFGWLLAMRIQQGIAGAIAFSNGAAMLREAIPDARRGGRFGLVGAAAGLAAATGPPLAGLLVWSGGWQTIFYVNVLLIVPAAWLGWRAFPRAAGAPPRGGTPRPFDLVGAASLCIALITAAAELTRHGAPAAWARLGWPLAGLAAIVFAVTEWRHPDPAVQLRLFARRAFAAANASVAASNFAMYVTLLAVPLLLAARADYGAGSSAGTGLVLAAMSGAMFIASPFGGWLADRWGRRRPAVLGLALLLSGTLLLAISGPGITIAALVGALVLVGFGIGTATAALQTTAVESVPARDAGMASGVYTTSRYLGSIVGSALLARLAAGGAALGGTAFIGTVFVMVAGAAVLALLAAFGLRDRPALGEGPAPTRDTVPDTAVDAGADSAVTPGR